MLGTCAWHPTDENNERPPLLKELGDHLVAVHILMTKATRAHHIKEYGLKVLLYEQSVLLMDCKFYCIRGFQEAASLKTQKVTSSNAFQSCNMGRDS